MKADIRSSDPKRLLQYYSRLRKVHILRKEYRERAFRKEMWDRGHEMRIELLLESMYAVEDRLRDLFTSTPIAIDVGVHKEVEEAEDTSTYEESIQEVSRYNARVLEEERQWTEVIPALILERRKELERQMGVVSQIVDICKEALRGDERRLPLFTESARTTYYVIGVLMFVLMDISRGIDIVRASTPGYWREGRRTRRRFYNIQHYRNILKRADLFMQFIEEMRKELPSAIPMALVSLIDAYCVEGGRYDVEVIALCDPPGGKLVLGIVHNDQASRIPTPTAAGRREPTGVVLSASPEGNLRLEYLPRS